MARNKNKISAPVQDTSISKFAPTPEQVAMFEEYGLNELLQACVLGDLDLFRANLSSKGRQISIKDAKEGSDAILWACYAGQSHIVDEILKKDASKINSKNNKGTNALQMACEFGGLELAKKLYNIKPSLLKHRDQGGNTVMHYACKGKIIAIIEWVNGLDNQQLNSENSSKETPLQYVLNLSDDVTEEFTNAILDLQSGSGPTIEQVLNSLSDDNSSSDDEMESKERPSKRAAVTTSENSDTSVASATVSNNSSHVLPHKKRLVQKAMQDGADQQQVQDTKSASTRQHQVVDDFSDDDIEIINTASSSTVASTSERSTSNKRKLSSTEITTPAKVTAKSRSAESEKESTPVSSNNNTVSVGIKKHFFIHMREGKLLSVQNFIKRHPDLMDVSNEWYGSIYHMACKYNQWNIIEWLLEQKPEFLDSVNKKGQKGYDLANAETKAKLDAYKNQLQPINPVASSAVASTSANIIVPQQPPVPQPTREQLGKQLFESALKGDINAVKSILDKNPDLPFANKDGVTALMVASQNGHIAVVKELLSKDKDNALLNAVNKNGFTALHIASLKGHIEAVKELLSRDKDNVLLNFADENGWTALMIASQNGHIEVVKELLSKDKDNALLNAANKRGSTALMHASQNGHIAVVKELLSKDKDNALLNAVNKNGITALMYASQNGHVEVVKELLSRNPALLTGVGKLNGQESNAFDLTFKFCKDENKKAVVLKFLFDQNPQFFAKSAAKLDVDYRKQIGIVLPSEVAQPVVIPAPLVVSAQAPVQNVSLVDRTNALRDAVVNAAQTEFSMNVDLQRTMNASGVASTLSGVQKFLAETSIIYLPIGVDFAAKGSLTDKVENTEIVFKTMMNEINRNITDPALSGYLSRI